MDHAESDLHQRIAARVRELRAGAGLSLEALATRSGVSRSMISLIERGECSPTAVVLEKLATGLGVVLASLFEPPAQACADAGPLARRAAQPEWRDPESGYTRRNVSPAAASDRVQIVDVHFPAGARVAFESAGRERIAHQQVWLLEGAMDITVGGERHRLGPGDCLAMELDRPILFHNPTRRPAHYVVVLAREPGGPR